MENPGPEPTLPAHADARARARDRVRKLVDEALERVVAQVEREATDPAATASTRYQARKMLIEAAAALRRAEHLQDTLRAPPRVRAMRAEPVYERVGLPPRDLQL